MRISDWSSDVCSSDLLTPNRLRRFGQACVLAAELPGAVEQIYAHFLHTPASVARYTALMTGLPWSASAHAKDIWTIPDWEKREKMAEVRRSEEHTSELQSLMRNSYGGFGLKKKREKK